MWVYSYLVIASNDLDHVGVIFKHILDAAKADEATTEGK